MVFNRTLAQTCLYPEYVDVSPPLRLVRVRLLEDHGRVVVEEGECEVDHLLSGHCDPNRRDNHIDLLLQRKKTGSIVMKERIWLLEDRDGGRERRGRSQRYEIAH